MKQSLPFALFCALVTALMAFPLLGLKLVNKGTGMIIEGATLTTWVGVALACLLVFLWQLFRGPLATAGSRIRASIPAPRLPTLQDNTRHRLERAVLIGVIVFALSWPFVASRGAIDLATLVLIYVMLGLGLNIVVGLAGLLDLGYVAFYAVGAYTYALLSLHFGFSFWATLPIAVLLAATFGFLLGFPVLRLRGDYLAIVTLGFGEIIRIFLNNLTDLTGGPNGIPNIPKPTLPMLQFEPEFALVALEFGRTAQEEGNVPFHTFFGLNYDPSSKVVFLYLLALLMCLVTIFIIRRLISMPVGRAWEALREDEIACRSLGLNRTFIKLSAFTLGASFAGFAGCLFAARQGFISPESFTFIESAIILAIVVLGGMGSQLGVILATVVMIVLPELAREFQEYRMLMFGLLIVLMMIWRPQGLLPMKRPQLHLRSKV